MKRAVGNGESFQNTPRSSSYHGVALESLLLTQANFRKLINYFHGSHFLNGRCFECLSGQVWRYNSIISA